MISLRTYNRQAGRMVVAVALLAATIVSSFLPALAWAAQLTDRSIELSDSTTGKAGVSYNIKFDQATNAGAVVVQFCTNTPLIGEFCDAPGGMVVTGATAGTGVTAISSATGSTIKLTKSGATEDLTITGIQNPSAAGTVYARVLTYVDATAAEDYVVDDDSSVLGTPTDQGGIAISFTNAVEVSGAVLESLTFCTSGAALTDADTDNNWCESATAPTLTLGHNVGDGVIALTSTARDTASVYTQLSTNASKGAVVRLKSNAICGGLIRDGDASQTASTACTDIPAAGTGGGVTAGTPGFGVIVETADLGTSPSTNKLVAASGYNDTNYRLNWVSGNATGVSSTYGDEVLNTGDLPVTDQGATLTFGASIGNGTAAGKYRATLSLIATGKF